MERRWLKGRSEVWQIYRIGWRKLNALVVARKVKRRKIGNTWYYQVASIERVFGGNSDSIAV